MVLCASFVGLGAPTVAQAQAEPAIHFINPSDFFGSGMPPVISAEDTGDGETRPEATTYRLNAWTKNAPSGAVVEFEFDAGLGAIPIGTAERVADDVFEFDWDVEQDVAIDGMYTLRALLFSGIGAAAEEIARDEVDVLVQGNQTDRSAVDLTYPTNAGPAGFYTNPKSGATNIMLDFLVGDPTLQFETAFFFYTVTPPGDEPAWKQCDVENSSPAVCNLESIDQGGGSVTAIGALATEESTTGLGDAAGDAVRVLPYAQNATTIFVEPATQRINSSEGDFGCSDSFEGFVVDQSGRPISNIPVDVHAEGPTDQLKFSNGDDATAPDEGHAGTEAVFDCGIAERPVLLDLQGDHNRPGLPDIKHEEETDNADNDDDNFGIFTVAVHSPTAGATQITFWADEDDDDFLCSQEPAVAASVGWDQEAPAPTLEQPEKTDCPIPEPPDPNQVPECSDGVDNDGDGETDHPEDDGCSSPEDDDETDEDDPRVCTIEGTNEGESIEGTDGDDIICGNGGDDIINGRGGNDIIFGDEGDDTIRGGPGDDTIDGGADNDTLRGGGGNDDVTGGAGNDAILGGSGADSLRGNRGSDTLRGGGGGDDLRGGRGNDTLRGGRGNDTLNGGSGTDSCRGGRGRDRQVNCE